MKHDPPAPSAPLVFVFGTDRIALAVGPSLLACLREYYECISRTQVRQSSSWHACLVYSTASSRIKMKAISEDKVSSPVGRHSVLDCMRYKKFISKSRSMFEKGSKGRRTRRAGTPNLNSVRSLLALFVIYSSTFNLLQFDSAHVASNWCESRLPDDGARPVKSSVATWWWGYSRYYSSQNKFVPLVTSPINSAWYADELARLAW